MTYLALKPGEIVLDPGCGTGIFPLTILGDLAKKSEDADSLGYLGIENDPMLALSTAISLDWVGAPRNWRVLYANFLNTKPKDLKKIGYPRIDAIICNPPFVRFHKLGERSELTSELGLTMFSGLHSYFLAHSSRLVEHIRMVFIVPMEMNGTRYGSHLLEKLQRKFTPTSRIMYYNKRIQNWHIADPQELTLRKHSQMGKIWTFMLFQPVSKGKTKEPLPSQARRSKEATVPLGSFVSIHRGISTGANDFFVMTEKAVKEIGIPKEYLKKVIPSRIRKVRFPNVFEEENWNYLREEGKPCWLLCLPRKHKQKNQTEELQPEVKQYIRKGERQGIHLIPTCRNRDPWYYINASRIPDLFFTYISRGYPKFVYNKARACILTNLLGVYLKVPFKRSNEAVANLIELLNSELKAWIDRESAGPIAPPRG